jgi:outer membrane receptor protein involved in Fe transport
MRFAKYLLLFTFLPMTAIASASNAIVKGKVVDSKKEPLEFVNVTLLDSNGKLVTGSIVDETGTFILPDVKNGNYKLKISYVGYETIEKNITVNAKSDTRVVNLHTFTLNDDSEILDEVAVVGQKSAMRLEIDKKVFDIGSQASAAGLSASEALENIPSVEVDSEGSISLRGSTSVTVWINGKAQGLTADNRGDILEQMPAESIDRIEVITNPSSKYSAEGSAGIINIILKRDRKAGYYGGIQLNANNLGGGRTGANINYSSGLLDAYANVGYGRRINEGGSFSDRDYLNGNGDVYANMITESENESTGNNLFTRAGATWHFTKKDDLGFGFMGMFGDNENDTDYDYTNQNFLNSAQNYLRNRHNHSEGDSRMLHGDINYRHEWKTNHTLDVQFGYNTWRSPRETYYEQYTLMNPSSGITEVDPNYSGVISSYQSQKSKMKNNSWDLQIDYVQPIGKVNKLEAGYKGTWRREDSPTRTWNDLARTQDVITLYNRFIYNMDIHAAYVNYGGKLTKRLGYQFGLRNEYWKVHTESTNFYQEIRERQEGEPVLKPVEPRNTHFNKIFPTAFISYQFNDNNELQFNYTRRMHRPWGGQLNSFQNISDSTSISYGNPELTPSYTNAFEINYLRTWEEHTLSVSSYYRPTSDVTQGISYMEDNIRYSTSVNVAKELNSGIEIVSKNKLWHKIDVTTTLNAYYHKLDGGDFTTQLNGKEYEISVDGSEDFAWNARMQVQAMLPGKISFQCRGNYNAPRKITQGTRESNWSFDASLKRQFFDGKFTVALNGRNLFNSRKWRSTTDYMSENGGYHQYSKNWRGNRRIHLQLNYTFGNMRAKKGDRNRDQNGEDPQMEYNGEGGGED